MNQFKTLVVSKTASDQRKAGDLWRIIVRDISPTSVKEIEMMWENFLNETLSQEEFAQYLEEKEFYED